MVPDTLAANDEPASEVSGQKETTVPLAASSSSTQIVNYTTRTSPPSQDTQVNNLFLARPGKKAREYFIQIGNLLSPAMANDQVYENYGLLLGFAPGILKLLKGDHQSTTTARAIVRQLFPVNVRQEITKDDFKDERRQHIPGKLDLISLQKENCSSNVFTMQYSNINDADLVRLLHSDEQYEKYKINEAINDPFRSCRFAKNQILYVKTEVQDAEEEQDK
ncbi:unnamed protein product [Didymodactylos carnosus]|uniref:Uncharacterized protein n=1 Tax=Didymodactylos carnosus TaxID=1234261 RepID=A0A815HG68_9BILA|nr:unnamed protein product [Didymodactylos carnosus]CAF1353569.1 unnamed protein product [Didymodactylos carnosus]CAF3646234.1 unnamed protein product [Didymodactylos carnosus]CAF4225698.1 unnamed protein product [Didymodactylos carnosus]